MKHFQNQKGFSLIELMIVIGIVGILAFVAYPSYTSAVMKSNRAEAKVGLTEVAQQLQRCFTAFGRFDDPDGRNRCSVWERLTTGDSRITTSGAGYYDITLSDDPAPTATTYTLVATPVKAPQTKDKDCGRILVNHAGQKTAQKVDDSDNDDYCWR